MSADLLTELHAEIAETRARPPEERHALALMELAERVNLPVDRLTELLATLEAQPSVTRELLLRRFVEAWLIATTGGIRGRAPRRLTMAKVLGGRQTVPLEEVVLAQAFQLEALLNVLERKGVISEGRGAGGDQATRERSR